MTTGEEGMTSDLMVELWGSSGPEVGPGWGDDVEASAEAAAAAGLLSTETF